jgi:hypothetical protein
MAAIATLIEEGCLEPLNSSLRARIAGAPGQCDGSSNFRPCGRFLTASLAVNGIGHPSSIENPWSPLGVGIDRVRDLLRCHCP